ncbi:MAG: hypothetical protein HYX67_12540 [Candidatus Melainabacteria bacterium]|nr:hypothetical protein [Candidatus Melainabacteria bacterium]
MTLIIVAFHLLLIIGIVLMVQAIGEKKKLKKALALAASNSEEKKPEVTAAIPADPISEQKQAVQMVHHGLENVVRHLTSIEGYDPEMAMAEITKLRQTQTAIGGTNEIT